MDHRITVDYSTHKGLIRKELYGSGLHIFVSDRNISDFSDVFKTLRFPAVRNHDWSLNNPNQRLIDIHHIFPLMHLDPADERNYYFAPSDEVIRLVYEAGSKVFYRLGTSIEHTKDIHFNIFPPADFHKYAEVCAAVIRHYTRGWNNGFQYDMKYWEIWNEPDGHINMWAGSDELFAEFFAVVLKRLKSEFPELKIGGPAHCGFRTELVAMLKKECDKLGVQPDFYSYRMYTNDLETPEQLGSEPRKYLDSIGWNQVECCINEWHFIRSWSGVHSNVTEESYRRFTEGRDGLMGINSAAFNIATFVIWQNSPVDSAFYYGCGRAAWSMQYPSRRFNKNYYSLLMMRDMVYDFPNQVAVSGGTTAQRAIAGISDDGSKAAVLVADFCGAEMTIPLEVKGFENPSAISCMVLDDLRDNERIECHQDESGLFLHEKSEPGSAVFLLVLEK
ncbi:MAG: hypothetical protein IKO65_08300 [Victivallales bacterium]|nr:hypothetical protein [Victivallales bacterium]